MLIYSAELIIAGICSWLCDRLIVLMQVSDIRMFIESILNSERGFVTQRQNRVKCLRQLLIHDKHVAIAS